HGYDTAQERLFERGRLVVVPRVSAPGAGLGRHTGPPQKNAPPTLWSTGRHGTQAVSTPRGDRWRGGTRGPTRRRARRRAPRGPARQTSDRKSTRLNSSHV